MKTTKMLAILALALGLMVSVGQTTFAGSLCGWGGNEFGQADVPTGNGFLAIAAGYSHSLALKSDGSIVGWGDNAYGQIDPPDGNDFVAIAAGTWHSLALKSDGSIVGWGYNSFGQATPPAGNDFVDIAAGAWHSLALKSDGSIAGWGNNNYGQATPPAGNDFVAIAADYDYSLALKLDGSIVGWGKDNHGQATPPAGYDFVAITAGGSHSLAIKSDGSIVGWGDDGFGQATPPAGNDFVAIAAGGNHSLALKADGSIVGWGNDNQGAATPPAGNDFVVIAACRYHCLAIEAVSDARNSLNAADGSPTNAVYVDDDGYVGIGTTVPIYELDVEGDIHGSGAIGAGQGTLWINSLTDAITSTSGEIYLGRHPPGDFSDVKVGIGTNGPLTPLDVMRDSPANEAVAMFRNINRDPASEVSIDLVAGSAWPNAWRLRGTRSGLQIENITRVPPAVNVLHNGDVGIGTESPGAKLEVNGQIKITGGSPGAGKVLTSDATGLASWKTVAGAADADWGFSAPPGSIYSLAPGNVGIGTTSPQNKLEVNGYTVVGSNSKGVRMRTDGVLVDIESLGTDLAINYQNGRNTVMNVVTGNVGIGTTSPREKLEVQGYNPRIFIDATSSNPELNLRASGKTEWAMYQDAWTGDLRFYQAGNKISFQNGTGKVGIGTTAPTEKLDVDGTARLRGISAAGGAATTVVADYNGKLWRAGISSRRYKTSIQNLESDPGRVLELRPVRFQWKTTGQQDIGLIAEEVEAIAKDLVIYDQEGRPDAVKYDKVAVYLLSVVKAQQHRIDTLEAAEAENESLMQRIEALEQMVRQQNVIRLLQNE